MKNNILLIFLILGIISCKQAINSTPVNFEKETVNSLRKYDYADSIGNRLIIQNSLPKGDGYIAPNGKKYFRVIFWTKMINETNNTLEFKIDFPSDFYEVLELPGNYYKVFIAPDTMTVDKEPLNNYGFSGLNSFLDNNFDKPTSLRRTIYPNSASGFYVTILSHSTNIKSSGALRTGFNLKDQDLIYKVSRYAGKPELSLISEKEIICGRINLKNLVRQK